MTDQNPETIRTRADGSIDTAFYMARGRVARSKQAHHMMSGLNLRQRLMRLLSWGDAHEGDSNSAIRTSH